MAEVKWIKITTSMFDDEKIRIIESMPDADSILIIWIKLLTLSGKVNSNGFIFLTEKIPYTDEMLSNLFNRPLNTVRLALTIFKQFGMVEYEETKFLHITNWDKHQNIEGLDKIREQNRLRQQRHKSKKEALPEPQKVTLPNVTVTLPVTLSNGTDIDIDIDIERDKERDKERDSTTVTAGIDFTPYQKIVDLYHDNCPSYSKVVVISANRKTHIKSRWKQHKKNLDIFIDLFQKAESSTFLKGENDRRWKANFDWMMNETNMTKVLEGKYDRENGRASPKTNADDIIKKYCEDV